MANSKVDSIEAESSKMRKDLIEAMGQSTKAKEKVKDPIEAMDWDLSVKYNINLKICDIFIL